MRYELTQTNTEGGIGYYACQPQEAIGLDAALAYLETHPNDSYMHLHILTQLSQMQPKAAHDKLRQSSSPVRQSLLQEAELLYFNKPDAAGRPQAIGRIDPPDCHSPLIYLRSLAQTDQFAHAAWMARFADNLQRHQAIAPDIGHRLPPLNLPAARPTVNVVEANQVYQRFADPRRPPALPVIAPADIAATALNRLKKAGFLAGPEMRHQASLAPWGLLRKWQMTRQVRCGRRHFSISGVQTAYGRGLELDAARASCAMEIVERCSAFAGCDSRGITDLAAPLPLRRARFSQLCRSGNAALDPNQLCLETPYADEPIYWLPAVERTLEGDRDIQLPAQAVFLFANFDEIDLFSSLGSTGMASGSSPAQAKIAAIHEIIERHSEATSLYHPSRCFRIQAPPDTFMGHLLRDYAQRGIDVIFQDMTPPMGIACCKCFVIGPDGQIAKGTGANLRAAIALVSALTETTYPYPQGPPSRPGPPNLPMIDITRLPDYTSGCLETDLALLETLILENGHRLIYVDLTRSDLKLPVVKAIIPGMVWSNDFDAFSRVSPQLWADYQALANMARRRTA